jgi:hypothetical protein
MDPAADFKTSIESLFIIPSDQHKRTRYVEDNTVGILACTAFYHGFVDNSFGIGSSDSTIASD